MSENALKPMWEALMVQGIAGVLFGFAAIFWPGITLVTLVYLFSIYVLVGGMVNIIGSLMNLTKGQNWFLSMILGFAQLGVGVYLVRHPAVTFATFILIIGLTLIARGVFEVVMALTEDNLATHKMMVVIGGVLSVLVGVVMLLQPASSGVAFVWILGLYALITGPIMIALALDVKRSA